ncbi:MAG: carbohydrate-binding domain-containing protein [Bacilli bacterium]
MKKGYLLNFSILLVFLSSCSFIQSSDGSTISSSSSSIVSSTSIEYGLDDTNTDYSGNVITSIIMNNQEVTINGDGAYYIGGNIEITNSGVYYFNGTLDNGQIIIESNDENTVWLVFDGIDITYESGAPIFVKEAAKTIVTLKEGSNNYLEDGATYILNEDEEPTAVFFSKDDLVINGGGSLNISANYNDGIISKDDLKIFNSNIEITALDDGIVGKDLLSISNANITINSGGDGLKSSNDKDSDKGVVLIENSNINIESGADSIQAESLLQINSGIFNLVSGGGSANSSSSSSGGWGQWGGTFPPEGSGSSGSTTSTSDSAKALKASQNILINDGTFVIDSSDDSIHSNFSIQINKGNYTLSSGDDGIHADSEIVINGGDINILKSYEGIESSIITINDGNINVVASDDGINVAGGNDSSSILGRPGQNNFINSSNIMLYINGGTIYVNASGDGIDVNGSIVMNSGNVYVNGPTSSANGALDYDGIFNVSGGNIIGVGSSGMAQTPSSTSAIYTISVTFTSTQSANKEIILKDSNDNILLSLTPAKIYNSLVITSEKLVKGETYYLYIGGQEYTSVILSSTITSIGNNNSGFPGNR